MLIAICPTIVRLRRHFCKLTTALYPKTGLNVLNEFSITIIFSLEQLIKML